MVHWLVDKGKLSLDETIANIWPEFGTNGKNLIKVHHILNHTSGLHNAMVDVMQNNPLLFCDWDQSLHHIAKCSPETNAGTQQLYHSLSFGWLCGAVIERVAGKKFKEVLEEAIVRPLNIEGELYIGIPPGVESRLATLSIDMDDLEKLGLLPLRHEVQGSLRKGNLTEIATSLPFFFNSLNVRRAIIPAANGHCSARALARYYAALADSGKIPFSHSVLSKPPLGDHPHTPQFPSGAKTRRRSRSCNIRTPSLSCSIFSDTDDSSSISYNIVSDTFEDTDAKIPAMFGNSKIHDAFMGSGSFSGMVFPEGKFGLGFRTYESSGASNSKIFGHSGVGGSIGLCNADHDFSIAVTVNRMSLGDVTRRIIRLVCSELRIPLPDEFSVHGD